QAVGLIDPHAAEPAPGELVLSRAVVAESLAQAGSLLAVMPHYFGPGNERVIDRAAQRLPADRRIHAVNPTHQKIALGGEQYDDWRRRLRRADRVGAVHSSGRVMAARKGKARIDIGGLADVPVR